MEEQNRQSLLPVQPYLVLQAKDYTRLVVNKGGISHFYEFTMRAGSLHPLQAVPDGSVDLVFGKSSRDVRTYIGGTVLMVKYWPLEEGRTYFGVRFQPGGCILPKGLSIHEIINDDLELDGDLYGRNLAEQIADGRNLQERAAIFWKSYSRCLMGQNAENPARRIEQYVRNRIYQRKGNMTIGDLSEETGYSECYIRRVFEQVHGISPKMFERIVRFQNVLNQMRRLPGAYGIRDLAIACGYFDQPHMMKEFKRFTGLTPETYRQLMAGKSNGWEIR